MCCSSPQNVVPDAVASPEALVLAPATPAAETVKLVRDAMRHEQEGSVEVALRLYEKAASAIPYGNPGRAPIEAKIAELQRKVWLQ